jgi:hypothetical protein
MAEPADRDRPSLRKWGRDWRIGDDEDVEWIRESTTIGMDITAGIPPIFADYATIVVPDDARRRNTDLVVQLLREHSRKQKWWLGFLDTGHHPFFPEAPRVSLYANWNYVLVLATPHEALTWCGEDQHRWHGPGPDLIFPTDRSWLMSWLWDDDWRCLGGSQELITAFLAHPELDVQRVSLGEDATPPGHVAL